MKRFNLFLTIFPVLWISACSPDVDCSSDTAVDTVKEILLQELRKIPIYTILTDVSKANIEIAAIRTRGKDASRAECVAELNLSLAPNKAILSESSGAQGDILRNLLPTQKGEIKYTVERTDDGKGIYVTIHP